MFFFLSKVLYFLIDPLIWIMGISLIGLFSKSIRTFKMTAGISVSLLILLTNPLLSNYALSKWESPAILKESLPLCDVGIVLTGITHYRYSPEDQIHFGEGADRITETIRLFKDGFIKKIILSGGSGSLVNTDEIESLKLQEMLLASGIRERNVELEQESRNTYENALYSRKLLDSLRWEDRKVMLITSAFHMPRALACFSKQGIDVIPYPVDFQSKPVDLDLGWIIPSADALKKSRILIREWVGMFAYRLAGYA